MIQATGCTSASRQPNIGFDRQILQSHNIAIKPDFELTAKISKLTGWTQAKLLKRGITKKEASRRLDGYGSNNRLLVTDDSDEIPFLEAALGRTLSPHRLNVSVMVALFTGNDINLGLEQMLALYNLQFECKPHSGIDDSRNIARLFLKLLPELNFSQSSSPPVDTTGYLAEQCET